MKKVTVFEASDGALFRTVVEAREHELDLQIKKRIGEHFQDTVDVEGYEGYCLDDVINYIVTNKKFIKDIISGKYLK